MDPNAETISITFQKGLHTNMIGLMSNDKKKFTNMAMSSEEWAKFEKCYINIIPKSWWDSKCKRNFK